MLGDNLHAHTDTHVHMHQHTPMHITITGNCGPPSSPQTGYINPYTNTLEGAEINITCLDRPRENSTIRSVCVREGINWSPDPAQLCNDSVPGIICTVCNSL